MRKSHKFIIVDTVFSDSADRDAHALIAVYIRFDLRPIIFGKVFDKLLRRHRQLFVLREAMVAYKLFDQLLFGRFFSEFDKNCRSMSVQYRYTQTLTGDFRLCCLDDLSVFDMSPDLQRFLLALFFLAADIRDDILDHFRPCLKVLARAGNRLVSCDHALVRLEFLPCLKCRHITLNRTVRLNSDEAACRAQTFLLMLDNLEMLRVDLRNDHRHVRRPAVRAVVGNDRRFRFGISFLDGLDFILAHIDRAEHEVHRCRDLFHLIHMHHHEFFDCLRNRCIHLPSSFYRLFIGLSGAASARREGHNLKPWMIFKQ